jgi:hypothetical protein
MSEPAKPADAITATDTTERGTDSSHVGSTKEAQTIEDISVSENEKLEAAPEIEKEVEAAPEIEKEIGPLEGNVAHKEVVEEEADTQKCEEALQLATEIAVQSVAAEVRLDMLVNNAGEIQWPQFTGPSSHIIRAPNDWCDRGILVPHEAFRWLHSAIRCVLVNFDPFEPGQDWKTAVFFNWLERYYVFAIHHHHHSEENIYNPAIVEKGGVLPTKITLDHKDILEGLERLPAFRTRLEKFDQSALPELKAHLMQLVDSIEDHLAEEEEAYPAALQSSSMTEEDEMKVVDTIIQSMGLDGNKTMLPSIVYAMHMWAGREVADEFVGKLPPPIRFAYKNFWLADFRANNLQVIQALQGSEFFTPVTPICGVFF